MKFNSNLLVGPRSYRITANLCLPLQIEREKCIVNDRYETCHCCLRSSVDIKMLLTRWLANLTLYSILYFSLHKFITNTHTKRNITNIREGETEEGNVNNFRTLRFSTEQVQTRNTCTNRIITVFITRIFPKDTKC